MSKTVVILIILLMGVLYRLILTSGGDFIFNMDNARDMVDVREMVVLHKFRLTGPTSAIEGLYNGPAWYYLLAIPYILSGGNPYAPIVLEIFLWAVGGFFLLKLVGKWGALVMIPVGSVWIASDYITLATRYAFNPNPVTLLAPLFVYLIKKYQESGKTLFSILTFLLAGLFFNFEMNAGAFLPVVLVASLLLIRKISFLKSKSFWIGVLVFLLTLMPQIIFDLRHQFLMSNSVINFLLQGGHQPLGLLVKMQTVFNTFYQVSLSMLMHKAILVWAVVGLLVWQWKKISKEGSLITICLALILVPFMGYLLLPVNVNLWHLGTEATAFLILAGRVMRKGITALVLGAIITILSALNVYNVLANEIGKPSGDASLFRNEITAIDYVYKKANGKNFKVYTYLPSVYDYPYQYLFWWYGQKNYGYVPGEYAYSPNKPQYIADKEKFEGRKDNFSELVFLIKEPDIIQMRQAWENDYKDMKLISKEMVGPLEVEIRAQL